MHILLLEDDETLGPLIEYKLRKAYHEVDWSTHVETAQSFISVGHYDLYILDWMLPDGTGTELCSALRKQGDSTPVLMLTARDAVEDRVKGLQLGADDYLVKPFAMEELLARIEALGRRKNTAWHGRTEQIGDLVLDYGSHTVTRNGQPIVLTRREFQLLACLMQNSGNILSREQILNAVWGMAEVTPNAVDATIRLLRKKIDEPFEKKYIHSHRGLGYRISEKGK